MMHKCILHLSLFNIASISTRQYSWREIPWYRTFVLLHSLLFITSLGSLINIYISWYIWGHFFPYDEALFLKEYTNDICMHNVPYISMGITSFCNEALFLKEGTNDIDIHEICLCISEVISSHMTRNYSRGKLPMIYYTYKLFHFTLWYFLQWEYIRKVVQ